MSAILFFSESSLEEIAACAEEKDNVTTLLAKSKLTAMNWTKIRVIRSADPWVLLVLGNLLGKARN